MGSAPLVADIDDMPRDFFDPGGVPGDMGDNQDPDGYFAQNLRDTMTLRTNMSGTLMYIIFTEFAMSPGDTLYIFDGPNTDAPLIGAYNLVQNPGEIYASDRMLTFVFHSDDEDILGLRAGWRAQVYAYSVAPDNRIWPTEDGTGAIQAVTCNAWFYDSGGANGKIATNNPNSGANPIYANFISPVGSHVKCEFSQFSVNGVMEIYDGQYADPNKRLIGQFCTSTLDASTNNMPPTLFSSGNALSFIYRGKAGDTQKDGWKAEITCVPELFETEDGNPCPGVTNDVAEMYANLFNAETKTIEWDCDIPIIMLRAGVIATGQYTSDYKVEQIPYDENDMLFGYDEGTVIPATIDDNWITTQQLPFTFLFFGKPYTTVYPGANGLISFSAPPNMSSCAWNTYQLSTPGSPPYSSTPYNYANCVYGVYEDIFPGHYLGNGAIRYGVLGSSPCRAFVFNYLNVGLYDCYSEADQTYQTYQMVLYEGTNIIDIYVKWRNICPSCSTLTNTHITCWNNSNGVIGLQNSTSSQILTVPGRDFSQRWTAQNEHWRFTPITPLDEQGELRWFVNDTNSAVYSRDKMITVSKPDAPVTKYISVYSYTDAAGVHRTYMDTTTILVKVPTVHLASSTGNNFICPNDPATLSATFTGYSDILPESYLWSTGDTTATVTVNPTESSTYTLTVTFDNRCDNKDTVRVKVTVLELPDITGTPEICYGESSTLLATHATSNEFHWSSGQSGATITVSPQVTTTYTVTATMEGDCEVTDTFTVNVIPLPTPSFMADPTEIYVENGVGTVTCTNLSPAGYHLVWNFGDVFSNMNEMVDVEVATHEYTRSGYYTITLTASDSAGCTDSVKARVSVEVPYFFYIPNAFSPDGDGVNETFAPSGEGVDPDQYSMQIFDRNGILIYSTHTPYDYWDGRNKYGQMCPEGVYVYIIRLVNLNGDDKEYTGSVTLVK